MINLIVIILIFAFSVGKVYAISNFGSVYALDRQTIFARVMEDDVYLYRNAIDNNEFSNIHFELPRTYFVELIDDYDATFYLASYMGIEGYVKKESVTAIVGEPNNPFLNGVNFRVYSEQSQSLRKLPTSAGGTDNQELYLPQDNLNITYIGKIVGEQLIKNRTNIWWFCKFTDDKEHFGYVYSEFCDDGEGKEIVIPLNNEDVVYTTSPNFAPAPEEKTSVPVESKTTWIIVAVLCVPAIIFVLIFLKGGKFSKEKKIATKEVRDY